MAKFRFKGLRNILHVFLGEAKSHVKNQKNGMGGACGCLDELPQKVHPTQAFQAPLRPILPQKLLTMGLTVSPSLETREIAS